VHNELCHVVCRRGKREWLEGGRGQVETANNSSYTKYGGTIRSAVHGPSLLRFFLSQNYPPLLKKEIPPSSLDLKKTQNVLG